jgi:MOSC domain-containing protein YiiM
LACISLQVLGKKLFHAAGAVGAGLFQAPSDTKRPGHTMPATMKVLHVCTGQARRTRINGRDVVTAIHKSPTSQAVAVGALGLQGDEQADLTVHGGLSKAVYAYPSEHLPFWQTVRAQAGVSLWDEPVPPGLLGENLLLQGVLETDLWVGDRLVLPHCTLLVSEPRLPCFKFAAAMGFKPAVKLMVQSAYCGSYLAVLHSGQVSAGDGITLHKGPREVNLVDLFRARARF